MIGMIDAGQMLHALRNFSDETSLSDMDYEELLAEACTELEHNPTYFAESSTIGAKHHRSIARAAAYARDAFAGRCRRGLGYLFALRRHYDVHKLPNELRCHKLRFGGDSLLEKCALVSAIAASVLAIIIDNAVISSSSLTTLLVAQIALTIGPAFLILLLDVIIFGFKGYLTRVKNICLVVAIVGYAVTMLVTIPSQSAQWLSLVSVIFLLGIMIASIQSIWDFVIMIARTCLYLGDLAVYIGVLLYFFAVVGNKAWRNGYYPSDWSYPANFKSLSESILSLYILLSTQSYPDAMSPAFHASSWAFLYFFSFMVFVAIILKAGLMAMFVHGYRLVVREKANQESKKERKACCISFVQLLKVQFAQRHEMEQNSGAVFDPSSISSRTLLDRYYCERMCKVWFPDANIGQVRLMFGVKLRVDIDTFCQFCECFNSSTKSKSLLAQNKSSFANVLDPYDSLLARIRLWFEGTFFKIYDLFMIISYAIVLFTVDSLLVPQIMSMLFFLYIFVDILAWNDRFFEDARRAFDFVVITSSCLLTLAGLVFDDNSSLFGNIQQVGVCLMILRGVPIIDRFTLQSDAGLGILKMFTGLILQFTFLVLLLIFAWAALGVLLFGGKIDTSSLPETYAAFDTLGDGIMLLFQILTTANFFVVPLLAVDQLGMQVAWYFCLYYLLLLFIFLNILVAMFVDALSAHRTLSHRKAESGLGDSRKNSINLERGSSGILSPGLSMTNGSFKNLFDGVDEKRAESLRTASLPRGRSGKGYTWRAITNVLNEVDATKAEVFVVQEKDSNAKRKWKVASRILLERNRLASSQKNVHSVIKSELSVNNVHVELGARRVQEFESKDDDEEMAEIQIQVPKRNRNIITNKT